MLTSKKAKQRLWIKVVRSEGGVPVVINEPVNMDSTIGDFMEVERLLNKIYGPTVTFDLQYEWKDLDIASAAEVRLVRDDGPNDRPTEGPALVHGYEGRSSRG